MRSGIFIYRLFFISFIFSGSVVCAQNHERPKIGLTLGGGGRRYQIVGSFFAAAKANIITILSC